MFAAASLYDAPLVRPATREDCFDLGPRLRKEDLEEISYSSGLTPVQSLLLSFRTTETYAVTWRGEVVALFGCGGIRGVLGVPWMLASPTLTKIRKTFLRECKSYVSHMLEAYGYLENYVWADNVVHIQWLEWLGFTLCNPEPRGIDGKPFRRFYMKKKECVNQPQLL